MPERADPPTLSDGPHDTFTDKDREIERLQREVERLEREQGRLRRENARLKQQLDAARRAGSRQAAPFAKPLKTDPRPPGRKAGRSYGPKACRQAPARVDDTYDAPLPAQCPTCDDRVIKTRVATQASLQVLSCNSRIARISRRTGHARKYVLDTQLFINAFRDPAANEALQQFHGSFARFEYLSVIVAQELRAGVQRVQDQRALERHVLSIFRRANRTITPSADAWHRSGDLLAEMARREGLEIARVSKAFANDIVLALSCREAGCVLVTDNERDFQRIGRFLQFEFITPWPRQPASSGEHSGVR